MPKRVQRKRYPPPLVVGNVNWHNPMENSMKVPEESGLQKLRDQHCFHGNLWKIKFSRGKTRTGREGGSPEIGQADVTDEFAAG